MKYIALGTSASLATKERGLPGGLLLCDSVRGMIDCGEGTARQLSVSGIGPQNISLIWLSHSHLDHYLGIAGLLWSLEITAPSTIMSVFCNLETASKVRRLVDCCGLDSVSIRIHAIDEGVFLKTRHAQWRTFSVHHTVPTLGLVIEEEPHRPFLASVAEELGVPVGPVRARLAAGKSVTLATGQKIKADDVLGPSRPGRKMVYVPDTENFEGLVDVCRGADLLVCESTYLGEAHALAKEFKHMTAKDAANLAKRAAVKQLVLTHISPRVNPSEAQTEARAIFEATSVAHDFSVVMVR